jgi:superoxide dismutase, Cu-Zn family
MNRSGKENHPMRLPLLLVTAAALSLAAGPARAGSSAEATLHDAEKKTVGSATLEETPQGILIHASLDGVPAGVHAFHVHETGKCEPPFTSAGGHWNPGSKSHGFESEKGAHAGDLPNIHVPDSGKLEFEVLAPGAKLAEMLDADGAALVIHAGADDYATDPAGDAGDRIACGVIEKKK